MTIRFPRRSALVRTLAGGIVTVGMLLGIADPASADSFSTAPAPRVAKAIVECAHISGSTWICQVRFSGGSSEYVCNTDAKVCIKQ